MSGSEPSGSPDDEQVEALQHWVSLTAEMAVGLDDRDPRGIYVSENEVLEGSTIGRAVCKLLHQHGEQKTEPALDTVTQEQIGTATYCARCGTVLGVDVHTE